MERKLASIQQVLAVDEIPNADNIQVATVKGWRLVIKRDEFKPNDIAIYCEIDSFLPIKEAFEFLRKSSYRKMGEQEGFRLRTVKLRGQVSQGLLLPITILNTTEICCNPEQLQIGDDVSHLLGIVKYEPPIPAQLAGVMKGRFPSFIPKTDEERVQNLTEVYADFKNSEFYITEKLDGTSATYYYNNGVFGVCSRNLELVESESNTFWKLAIQLQLEEKLKRLQLNIALQGELIGESIQGNPYKLKGQQVRFFGAFNIDEQRYFTFKELEGVIILLELQLVPLLYIQYNLPETIEQLLLLADGKSQLNPAVDREGIVLKDFNRTVSFKVISNKFLLQQG